MQELKEAGGDPHRLDALFERYGESQPMVAELAGTAWKKVFFDPEVSAEERRKAGENLLKYARVMMASEATFTHRGKTIPMLRWKGQGLKATVEQMDYGMVMPDFGFTDLAGQPVSLAAHRGKVLLLDFWATWCKPCLAAMPKLREFGERLAGKPFAIISVNYGDSLEKVGEFLAQGEVPMPWIHWHQETFTEEYFRLSLGSLPTYIVLDREGRILARGGRFDERMQGIVLRALGEPVASAPVEAAD